jgi:aldose sugar dehydrogenase
MRAFLASLPALALLAACGNTGEAVQSGNSVAAQGSVQGSSEPSTNRPFQTAVLADFEMPWAMTFLPDRRMLVTEKNGQLLLVSADAKQRVTVSGTPAVDTAGQGGLMDVVLHPDFRTNGLVYLSASQAGAGGKGVVLMRGRLAEQNGQARLDNLETIFRATPFVEGDGHYSGRIAFSPDGRYLFFTNGERQQFEPAQDPAATLGKVLRLMPDGRPAPGNPLASQGFHPAVWSYGHRNLLGIAFDADGNLWQQEMGPKGGDEVNLVLPGRNYGYPRVSNGSHYDGRDIPDHAPGDGYEAPKAWWNPSISPAGLIVYTGSLFPNWKNSVFIGAMSKPGLIRVPLNGTSVGTPEFWDMDGARIREVEQGPDGALYVLEDGGRGSQGRLLRLTPA